MANLTDNPLLVKHIRSRMRRHQALPTMITLALLSGCIWWIGLDGESAVDPAGQPVGSGTFLLLLFIQGFLLLIMGTGQVAAAVSRAHNTGILDFHRASPLPSSEVTIGFLLGAPIREYVGFAVVTPFTLLAAMAGPPGLGNAILVLAVMLVSGWLFHALAIVAGLLSSKGRTAGAGVVGILVASHFMAGFVYAGYPVPGLWTAIPALTEVMGAHSSREFLGPDTFTHPTFFGAPWSLVTQSLIYQLPVLAFLLLAAVRRMSSERAHLYTKPAGALLLVVLCVLAMGGLVDHAEVTAALAMPLVLCVIFVGACVVTLAVTPDRLSYSAGLRRATRAGSNHNAWSEEASNGGIVVVLAMITIVAGLITANIARTNTSISWESLSIAGSAVLAFGFGLQWLALAHRRRAIPYFMLFLFVWGVMPLVVGALLRATGPHAAATTLGSLSPFSGIIHPTTFSVSVNLGLALVLGVLLRTTERNLARSLGNDSSEATAAAH